MATGVDVVMVGKGIIEIIKLANTAQFYLDSCGKFKEYIEKIHDLVNIIMKTDVINYHDMERLQDLVNDSSKSLLQYCNDKKSYQNWFGDTSSIPEKLTAQPDEIKKCLDLTNKGLEGKKKADVEAKKKAEAETRYRDLLTEKITHCEASWTNSEAKLENFHIDRERRKTMFREHVAGLLKAASKEEETRYGELLTKKITDCEASWTKSEAMLKKFHIDREIRETMFLGHVAALRKKEETRYGDLLTEKITHWEASWTNSEAKLENFHIDRERRETMFREHVAGLLKAASKEEETRYGELLTQKITDCEASWTKSEAMLEKFHIDRERRETMFHKHVAGLVKAARMKEETRYRDLLTRKITDCKASWTKSEAKLENFHIDRERRETMFREHVAGLLKKEYGLLLDKVIGKKNPMSWEKAKPKLMDRTEYKNLPEEERKKQFDEYVKGHKVK